MNAKAGKITFKDVHRVPPPLGHPCIRPFLKGLSWKIKSGILFFFGKDPQSKNRCDTSNLYFVHTSEKNDTDSRRGSGRWPERRTLGVWASNGRVHLSSLLPPHAGSAGGEKGLCPRLASRDEGLAKRRCAPPSSPPQNAPLL